METNLRKFAIKDKNNNWFITPSFHGNEFVIYVLTLEEALHQLNSYHKGRGFRIAKIIK